MINRQKRLLDLYDLFPFERHPLWMAVKARELTYAQVISAEIQHWLRTRAGQVLRRNALQQAGISSPKIAEALLETYVEEVVGSDQSPNHLQLIERLVTAAGITQSDLDHAKPTAGNAAAIALYKDIGSRGAGCHVLGAGAVEHHYCRLSPHIYAAYTQGYGMTEEQAETYRIHGPMDAEHAERAFSIMDEAIAQHGWDAIELSVRDAFAATSLHYDGMLQAATGQNRYWSGTSA